MKHDHKLKKQPRGALKHALVACNDSPSKLKKGPKSLVGQALIKLDQKLTQKQQIVIKRKASHLRVSFLTKDLLNGRNGSLYSNVVDSLLNKYSQDATGNRFGIDGVYLVGNAVNVDRVIDKDGAEKVRFYCVLSTEKLLLNGPRQVQTRQQLVMAVDRLYCYFVKLDHGLFVIKTINHCQSAKTIANPICIHEDKEALVWIFKAIQEEIEANINNLIKNDIKYI